MMVTYCKVVNSNPVNPNSLGSQPPQYAQYGGGCGSMTQDYRRADGWALGKWVMALDVSLQCFKLVRDCKDYLPHAVRRGLGLRVSFLQLPGCVAAWGAW